MKTVNKNAGFTLVEIIITIVILGIMGLMTFAFIGDTADIYGITTAQARLNDQMWVAMERITRELDNATGVTAPADLACGATLTFTKAACATCVDTTSTTITYSLNTGLNRLERTTDIYATAQPLAENITAFTACKNGNITTIDMTGSDTAGGTALSITLSTSVYPNSDFEENIQ